MDDTDITNFVNIYPSVIGKRLDDCQTCHRSATLSCMGRSTIYTVCDYCHLIQYPSNAAGCVDGATPADIVPTTYQDTLNPYGSDYLKYGRDRTALQYIDGFDSDGDGYANGVEIAALTYPGDPTSYPGLPQCPIIILNESEIKSITPTHGHLQLSNTSKQQFDSYDYYEGVKVQDLLNWLAANKGVDLTGLNGLSFIAPDGFEKGFGYPGTLPSTSFTSPANAGILKLGLDDASLGSTCGFVDYPPAGYLTGLSDGSTLGIHNGNEQWMMIAYNKNGAPLDTSYYDPTTLTLQGEGPFRLVVPQFQTSGGDSVLWPDRGSKWSGIPACSATSQFDYRSSAIHNAGAMVRGLIVVRLEPMPTGCEEFDWENGGFAYIDDGELLIYGNGVK
jgi:hypothetical protein